MKRNELVDKLVKEGLSEKTLSKLTDNQLNILGNRMLGEQMSGPAKGSVQMKKAATNPSDVKKMTDSGVNVTLTEKLKGNQSKIDKNHNRKIDGQDFKILQGQKKKKETNEAKGKNIDAKDKKQDVKEGTFSDTGHVAHGDYEIPVYQSGDKKMFGHPRKKGDLSSGSNKYGYNHDRLPQIKKAIDKFNGENKDGKKTFPSERLHFDESKPSKGIKKESVNKNSWVKNLVENEFFHNFTSKGEIMNLIQTKLNENETMVQHGPKVKKGHNGIPEFMSYDVLAAAEPKTAPAKPKTAPGTKPSPGKAPSPKHPYAPGPAEKPEPKAQMGEQGDAPVKDPKIKEKPKKQDKPGHPYRDPSKKDKPERKA